MKNVLEFAQFWVSTRVLWGFKSRGRWDTAT